MSRTTAPTDRQIRVRGHLVDVSDARTLYVETEYFVSYGDVTPPSAAPLERTFTMRAPRRVDQWTADDLIRVIDRVRAGMPKADPDPAAPDVWGNIGPLVGVLDRYTDGRRIGRISMSTIGYVTEQAFLLSFLTKAHFVARVWLPTPPPMAALLPLLTSTNRYCDIEIGLNTRAAAALSRRRLKAAEDAVVWKRAARRRAGEVALKRPRAEAAPRLLPISSRSHGR